LSGGQGHDLALWFSLSISLSESERNIGTEGAGFEGGVLAFFSDPNHSTDLCAVGVHTYRGGDPCCCMKSEGFITYVWK
jgi:hypothetical protein